MFQVAVIDDYQGPAAGLDCWQELSTRAEVSFFQDHLTDTEALVERLQAFDAVIAMRERTPFPAAVMERLPKLRLLITTGMSNAAIDVDSARSLGITVCGTRLLPHPAAELTWALILELAKRTGAEETGLRVGVWQSGVGLDLDGATLGVVGLGKLGRRVAAIGAAFGMNVLAWSQNLTLEQGSSAGVEVVSKEELFRRSDYVTIHLRYSERTRSVVGEAELGLMKPTAYLVNTSRAPIVDQEALLVALHGGWIGGAGLDVHLVEPIPASDPILRAPNTVLTPHIGYATRGNFELSYSDAVEDVTAFLADRPVRVL
ncbi:D-2-hydroxyacid dehydrogenase family protein [Saccharothrix sp. ST-888]|uniref:D-2-hydroxyacid dehydrogenase family protein n=1 Tax=Saccharothrix sp. ST-888 TaxID=1427391 RepID=UPI0005ECA3F9|nr:2-hydroxyacid dehydrogenase [Saccharothrix sp. ST-888]